MMRAKGQGRSTVGFWHWAVRPSLVGLALVCVTLAACAGGRGGNFPLAPGGNQAEPAGGRDAADDDNGGTDASGSIPSGVFARVGPGGGGAITFAAFHPTDPDRIYVASDTVPVHFTSDGGRSWEGRVRGVFETNRANAQTSGQHIAICASSPDVLLLATEGGLFRSIDAGESWSRITTIPHADYPWGIVAIHPHDPNRLYAIRGLTIYRQEPLTAESRAAGTELFVSTDGGRQWTTIEVDGGNAVFPEGLAIDDNDTPSTTDDAIYISTLTAGILRSTDGGGGWSRANAGLHTTGCRQLALRPVAAGRDVLYVATLSTSNTQGGVYRSIDGASSWHSMNDLDGDGIGSLPLVSEGARLDYWTLVAPPGAPGTVIAGTLGRDEVLGDGIYETTDDGRSWIRVVDTYMSDVAGTGDPMRHGWENAWNQAPVTLAVSTDGARILYGDTEPRLVVAGIPIQAYTDGVHPNWRTRGMEISWCTGIAFHPTNPREAIITYDDIDLFKLDPTTGDIQIPYAQAADPPGFYQSGSNFPADLATSPLYDPDDARIIYAGGGSVFDNADGRQGFLVKSTDGGMAWRALAGGLPSASSAGVSHVTMAPGGTPAARTLYATFWSSGVYKSTDSGASWTAAQNGLSAAARQNAWRVYVDPTDARILYLGQRLGANSGAVQLWKSNDFGASWSPLLLGHAVRDLVVRGGSLIAACGDESGESPGGIFTSTDGGATWTERLTQPCMTALAPHPARPGEIYAASSAPWSEAANLDLGIWRTLDGGMTWQKVSNDVHEFHMKVIALRFNPHDPGQLFIATQGRGLVRFLVGP